MLKRLTEIESRFLELARLTTSRLNSPLSPDISSPRRELSLALCLGTNPVISQLALIN